MDPREIVRWVIEHFEGFKYTDDPVDTGGATKFGITLRTLAYWRRTYLGQHVTTKQHVRDLTLEDAIRVGVDVFMNETGIAQIKNWRTMLAVYDYSFHSGFNHGIKEFQRVLGVDADGKIGPKTLAAEATADVFTPMRVLTLRETFMQDIMTRKHTQRKWMLGWWIRTTKLQAKILEGV